ncbi:MAG: SseB family protein [Lachnospiraceae bacterium]|nr:SseB family protein [Lachnospiraceae bacterium]
MEQKKELSGNEQIEEAILQVQKEPSEEALAHALTAIRRQMKAGAHLIVAVDSIPGEHTQISLRTITTNDGKRWFVGYTGFEEQLKDSNPVMSSFTAPISQIFEAALSEGIVEGVILNPWNRTMLLNKQLIRIIFGS